MASRYITATARLFAPLSKLHKTEVSEGGAPPLTSRPWELRRERSGQSTPEAYTLTILTSLLFFAGSVDLVSRIIPLRGAHLAWMVALAVLLVPLALAEVTLISALAGDTARYFGLFRKWSPARRTGLFFHAACILYAAWATREPGFIRAVGYAWLALISINGIAAVILNTRASAAVGSSRP